jgi:hypothetical protein
MRACLYARNSFRAIFGKRATIEAVLQRLQNPKEKDEHINDYGPWLGWLMGQTPELTIALLKAGANVHVYDDFALRWAARDGYVETVKILLKAGANVHACDDYALYLAEKYGNKETVKILKRAMKAKKKKKG